MLCEKFDNLSNKEKKEFIGSLCHAAQSDDALFDMAQELIRLGELKGLFDGVKIMPEVNNTKINEP